jgi:hypothetical protein
MRMRGLEPPPGFPDTDLNRARLPIPPHPRVGERAKISHRRGVGGMAGGSPRRRPGRGRSGRTRRERFASLDRANCAPLSSRGLGRRPLMAETRVRIPVAVLQENAAKRRFWASYERRGSSARSSACSPRSGLSALPSSEPAIEHGVSESWETVSRPSSKSTLLSRGYWTHNRLVPGSSPGGPISQTSLSKPFPLGREVEQGSI